MRFQRTPFGTNRLDARIATVVFDALKQVHRDGRPRELTAHFDRALDDPSLVWLRWQGHTYVSIEAPRGTHTEPAVDFLKLLD